MTAGKNEQLKPCPFCGGKAVRMSFLDDVGTRYVGCKKCDAVISFGMCPTEGNLRKRWNKREGA